MRRHTTEGAALLDGLALAADGARRGRREHPSRALGRHGLPQRPRGDEIPLPGRIAAVCDVFDALITERPYKRAWSLEEARAEIAAQRGRHFDPAVVDAFFAVIDRGDHDAPPPTDPVGESDQQLSPAMPHSSA